MPAANTTDLFVSHGCSLFLIAFSAAICRLLACPQSSKSTNSASMMMSAKDEGKRILRELSAADPSEGAGQSGLGDLVMSISSFVDAGTTGGLGPDHLQLMLWMKTALEEVHRLQIGNSNNADAAEVSLDCKCPAFDSTVDLCAAVHPNGAALKKHMLSGKEMLTLPCFSAMPWQYLAEQLDKHIDDLSKDGVGTS